MQRKFIDIDKTAERIGLTPKATRLKIARGQLPFRRLGKRILVPEDELEEYLDKLPGCDVKTALARIEGATHAKDGGDEDGAATVLSV